MDGRQFTAKKHPEDRTAEIIIFDEIGASMFSEGVTAKSVQALLDGFGDVDTITVRINSPGGAIFDGLAIYNLLHQHKARIIVEIDGLAASAASVIAMAGDEIRMAENALMMVHAASGFVMGDAEDMRETAELLDKITANLIDIYTARSGRDRKDIEKLVSNETWMTAEEALAEGLITDITDDKEIAAKAVSWMMRQGKVPVNTKYGAKVMLGELELTGFEEHEFSNKDTPVHSERKQQTPNQGTQMEWFKALGFDDEAKALASLPEVMTFQNGVVSALGASSPADAVQRLTNMTSRIATLEADVTAQKALAEAGIVDAQIKDLTESMKLAPAMHDWFRKLPAEARNQYAASAPALVPGTATPTALVPGATITLTAEDEILLNVCQQTNPSLTREMFIEARTAEMKGVN